MEKDFIFTTKITATSWVEAHRKLQNTIESNIKESGSALPMFSCRELNRFVTPAQAERAAGNVWGK